MPATASSEPAAACAAELGLGRAVRLQGWVAAPDLERIYRKAHMVVLPSYAKGVPMAVMEAMSHGVPVACTPVGGLPELISHELNGLFCQPGDIPQLCHQIGRVLGDPALAAMLGAAGHEVVLQHATTESTSVSLEALYADVARSTTGKKIPLAAT